MMYPALPQLTFLLLLCFTILGLIVCAIANGAQVPWARKSTGLAVLLSVLLMSSSLFVPDCYSWGEDAVTITGQNRK